jgi:hypothetical protein
MAGRQMRLRLGTNQIISRTRDLTHANAQARDRGRRYATHSGIETGYDQMPRSRSLYRRDRAKATRVERNPLSNRIESRHAEFSKVHSKVKDLHQTRLAGLASAAGRRTA